MNDKIRKCWPGEILWGYPMSRLSTLKVGGPAEAVIFPGSQQEFENLVCGLIEARLPWRVIGRGSNILVADRGVDGVVVVLAEGFAGIREIVSSEKEPGGDSGSEVKVHVEAGCSLAKLTKWCARKSISGLEFAAGIPGSVGGAIVMNAGAWGGKIADPLDSLVLFDGGRIVEERPGPEDFEYRRWRKRQGRVVVAAVFAMQHGHQPAIEERCRRYHRKRQECQPRGVASAGSFFKNPPGHAAGRLIEAAGLKGYSVGGAVVSAVHANFLVNKGDAMAADFKQLIRVVQDKVEADSGVVLEPEVELIGVW